MGRNGMEANRRELIAGTGGLLALATAAGARAQNSSQANATACPPPVQTEANGSLTADLAKFAVTLRYEDLPAEAVDAARRSLLDAIGCGLAGWETRKGRLAAACMERLGGAAEASVFGRKAKLPAPSAAFANAELMNALDFDAIPHLPPVTLPAILALAEQRRASGRDLILATVISYELAARLSAASSPMTSAIIETGTTPEVFGINTESIMANAAALGRIAGLQAGGIEHAIGLAGYYCPPQASHDWETGTPKSNVKYTPVGPINQQAVQAALLAESGYTGNPRVLDGPAGFARFYGWSKWDIPAVRRGLGEQWRIVTADYKPHACCRYIHSRIDALVDVIARYDIRPDAIESILSLGPPFVANPDQMNVRTQEDAQFSVPYMLALVALRIPLDARCQSAERLADPEVRRMMQRIRWETHPRNAELRRANPRSFLATVEVRAGGRSYSGEAMYAKGAGAVPEARLTDSELDAKFLDNARVSLSPAAARRLLDAVRRLGEGGDAPGLAALWRA